MAGARIRALMTGLVAAGCTSNSAVSGPAGGGEPATTSAGTSSAGGATSSSATVSGGGKVGTGGAGGCCTGMGGEGGTAPLPTAGGDFEKLSGLVDGTSFPFMDLLAIRGGKVYQWTPGDLVAHACCVGVVERCRIGTRVAHASRHEPLWLALLIPMLLVAKRAAHELGPRPVPGR